MTRIRRALSTYVELNNEINSMTEEEVLAALQQETDTLRRTAIIDRLISRAVRLNEIKYSKELKAKYYGS